MTRNSFLCGAVALSVLTGLVLYGAAKESGTEARLKALETKVQRLDDIHEIERLQRVYGYYLDKRLWDEVIPLFTDDCSIELAGRGVYIGRKSAETLFRNIQGAGKQGPEYGRLYNHMQLQGVVDVDPGGQTAKGRWRAFMQIAQLNQSAIWGEGPYEVDYVKVNGKWMFKKMHWYTTYLTPYDQGWAKVQPTPFNSVSKEYPPDQPPSENYQPFPSVYIPPFHYKNPITGK